MITLGIIDHFPSDAVSFWRCYGAFGHMTDLIRILPIQNPTWDKIIQCDVIFLQRPYTNDHAQVCEMIRALRVPLWLDFDDNLWEIPVGNPARNIYNTPVVLKNMDEMCGMASALTTTTQYLADVIKKRTGKTANVVPNAFNDFLWGVNQAPRTKTIAWRGSATHHADMEPFLPAIESAIEAEKEWTWHFYGVPHWRVEGWAQGKFKGRVICHGYFENLFLYLGAINELSPDIVFVPLVDSSFNRSKSNIAYLEASQAGAITIAPHWKEWTKPGVITYMDIPDFGNNLRHALYLKQKNRDGWREHAVKHIKEHYRLSDINKIRFQILEGLAGMKRRRSGAA